MVIDALAPGSFLAHRSRYLLSWQGITGIGL